MLHLITKKPTKIEQSELIEQMRIIEHGFELKSVPVSPSLPSINELEEPLIVLNYIRQNPEQQAMLEKILNCLKCLAYLELKILINILKFIM